MRALSFGFAALVAGCATSPSTGTVVHAQIAEGVQLNLPVPPNFPQAETLQQLGRARYGDRRLAFDAVLTLSQPSAEIVIAAAGGPRLATIHWDSAGIRKTLSARAPRNIPIENLLADVFLLLWPPEAITAALPEDVIFRQADNGARTLSRNGEVMLEITPEPGDATRTLIRNHAFGYEISVLSQSLN